MAAELITQAQVQQAAQPLRRAPGPALPELAAAPGVLIYDIESDPDARDDFLHGFVCLARRADGVWPQPDQAASAPYRPLLALLEHGEARLWQRLRQLLQRYPDWPVLHYGETERLALLRMAQRQGARESDLVVLRQRLVDVHQRLRQHWWMPTTSYGLKSTASWLGFRWRQKGWMGPGPCCGGDAGAWAPVGLQALPVAVPATTWAGSSATTTTMPWPPGRWPTGCWRTIRRPEPVRRPPAAG